MANIQINNLTPGKTYNVQVRARNGESLSAWSEKITFTASADSTPPSTPSAALIWISSASTDYQNTLTTRVKINGYTSASQVIETDTSYFEVYASSVNPGATPTESSGTKVGDVNYVRTNGVTSEATLNLPISGASAIASSSNVYFFIRAVDRSGNKSPFSTAVLPTKINYFQNAYISDLSADKITTGTLQANQQISVGNTTPIVLKSNTAAPVAQLYNGTGNFNNSDTPFYLDSDYKFSLGNKFVFSGSGVNNTASIAGWIITSSSLYSGVGTSYVALTTSGTYALWAGDPTDTSASFRVRRDGALFATGASISGNIIAQSGSFSGSIVANGVIYGGLVSGASITSASITSGSIYGNVITGGSITGTIISGASITGGTITASTGTVGGWTLANNYIYNYINAGSTTIRTMTASANSDIIEVSSNGAGYPKATAKISMAYDTASAGIYLPANFYHPMINLYVDNDPITRQNLKIHAAGLSTIPNGHYKGLPCIEIDDIGGAVAGYLGTWGYDTITLENKYGNDYTNTARVDVGKDSAGGFVYISGGTRGLKFNSVGLDGWNFSSPMTTDGVKAYFLNVGTAAPGGFNQTFTNQSVRAFFDESGRVWATASGAAAALIHRSGSFSTGAALMNFYANGGTVGQIVAVSASTCGYNTSSDYRIKTNIESIPNAIVKLNRLNPVLFNFVGDESSKKFQGFLAHEVQDVIPGAVSGEKDAVDENGDLDIQTMDYAKLTPLLTAALQEAVARIENLEKEITYLKSKQ